MKRSLILLLVVALVVSFAMPAFARDYRRFKKHVNEDCSDCEKAKMEVGLGVDVPLWKNEKLVVDQETKVDLNEGGWDFEKSNISTYTVFKPQMKKGIFQILGDLIKGDNE